MPIVKTIPAIPGKVKVAPMVPNKDKIRNVFGTKQPFWKTSLVKYIQNLNN